MTIYVEYLVLDNFITSYLSLIVSGYLTKISIKKFNVILASTIFTAFALILPLLNINLFISILTKILILLLMCLIVLKGNEYKSKLTVFLFVCITLNLIIYAILSIIAKLLGGEFSFGVYYLDFPISAVLLCVYLYFKILLKYFSRLKRSYEIDNYIYEVEIQYNQKSVKLKAFLDSGNSLFDTIYNLPIAVIQIENLTSIIGEADALCLLMGKKCENIETLHYIEYYTASSKRAKMPVFKLDKMNIQKNGQIKSVDCMLGVSFAKITNGINYDMLIGLKMIE